MWCGGCIAACKYAFDYTPKTCSQTKAMPKVATMGKRHHSHSPSHSGLMSSGNA